jgi:hypothetical protein
VAPGVLGLSAGAGVLTARSGVADQHAQILPRSTRAAVVMTLEAKSAVAALQEHRRVIHVLRIEWAWAQDVFASAPVPRAFPHDVETVSMPLDELIQPERGLPTVPLAPGV